MDIFFHKRGPKSPFSHLRESGQHTNLHPKTAGSSGQLNNSVFIFFCKVY
jgi:hypothetical protein